MPPVQRCQIEGHEFHHGEVQDVHLSLAVALSTMQVKGRILNRNKSGLPSLDHQIFLLLCRELPEEWRSWLVAGLVRPSLWVPPRPNSMDSHNAKNPQLPYRVKMQHVKDPWSDCLASELSAKLNFSSNSFGTVILKKRINE
ncbi:hypothetical protein TNCV_2716251 [Trichonephila clavipes]|nr:hypothetical protein TNCV_2716251 [Trichonephila clavipes]